MSNRITDLYVNQCLDDEELRRVTQRAPFPAAFAQSLRGSLLSRPLFTSQDRILQLADDLARLYRLMLSLPHRLFDGDLDRYCAAVGIDPREAELIVRDAGADPPLFGRCDAYIDATGFRLLEFNIGSDLGAIDMAEYNRALLRVDAFGDFAERHGLRYVDTAETVADLLRTLAGPVATGDRPVVAILEATGGLDADARFQAFAEAMRLRGLDFRLAEVQQVEYRAGRLHLDGAAIDVAIRYHSASEILEGPYGPEVLEPIRAARRSGGTILFTGLEHQLYNNKGTLALLSDERYREAYGDDERRLIDRLLPWTRLLVDDPALIERCRVEQADLIVKPSVGWGGRDAVLGREVSPEHWQCIIEGRIGNGHVVQRVVVPVPEPVPDPGTGKIEDWHATWGVFVTEAGYAGAYGRIRRPSDGGIITLANPGTCQAGVFLH